MSPELRARMIALAQVARVRPEHIEATARLAIADPLFKTHPARALARAALKTKLAQTIQTSNDAVAYITDVANGKD